MPRLLDDHRIFWRQFRRQFHTTGAILPSGRALGRALARYVGHRPVAEPIRGRRILEVGPGTGAVTTHIVERLASGDRLDLVELNEEFVGRLNERFAREASLHRVAPQTRILHAGVEELVDDEPYDLVISGLPLNNFSVDEVEQLLDVLVGRLKPDGILSFFQYIAIRPARALVSRRTERARLRGIGRALDRLLASREIRRDCVLRNVPPAWVHHVKVGSG